MLTENEVLCNLKKLYGAENAGRILAIRYRPIKANEVYEFYKLLIEISANKRLKGQFYPEIMAYLKDLLTELALKNCYKLQLASSKEDLKHLNLESPTAGEFEIKHQAYSVAMIFLGLTGRPARWPTPTEIKEFYRQYEYAYEGLFGMIYFSFNNCLVIISEVSNIQAALSRLKVRCLMSVEEYISDQIEKYKNEISCELQQENGDVEFIGVTAEGIVVVELIGQASLEKTKELLQKHIPSIKDVKRQ